MDKDNGDNGDMTHFPLSQKKTKRGKTVSGVVFNKKKIVLK